MAKKRSFADKAAKAEQKQAFSMVRYVKPAVSKKTGHYRFQERMLKVPTGMTLDAYLKGLEKGTARNAKPDKRSDSEGPSKPEEEARAETQTEEQAEDGPKNVDDKRV